MKRVTYLLQIGSKKIWLFESNNDSRSLLRVTKSQQIDEIKRLLRQFKVLSITTVNYPRGKTNVIMNAKLCLTTDNTTFLNKN